MDERQPFSLLQPSLHNGSVIKTKLTPIKGSGEISDLTMGYKELLAKGKSAASEGNLMESLDAYKKAYKMKPTDKIEQRIKKIEDVLKEMEDDNEEFIELKNNLIIYRDLAERLYPHQIEGVQWMFDLMKFKKKGGILADDMGLGKTIQVISVLSAMFDMELIQHVLLVLPLSLIPNWQREFEKWAPGIKIKAFHGSVSERTRALEYSQRRPSVLMTTYGLVQTKWEQLGQTKFRQEFIWDYIILDEGHKIKNPSKTTKGLHAIPSKNRLILTGTPIQNNLRELWALFDWVMQGTLLGTQKTFRNEYATPITKARERGASSAEIHLGNYMSESLRKIVDPYILRRTKSSVSVPKPNENGEESQSEAGNKLKPSFPKLKKKNDFVIWTYLSSVQEEIYRDFLGQDSIKELLASKRSPLVYLTILKKICDHPRLLPRRACHQLGLEANDSLHEDDFHTDKGKECAANRIDNISDQTLIEESGKLQFLLELLKRLRDEGHRTLIFSLSRKMLNMIHRILLNNKFKVMRLDGTVSKLSERELRVKKFQQDSSYDVFLLTTQVGGVGLTLTAADRVVIYDPSWNPATDAQAVDRIYRIGQEKNVVVYRLITCGTVEEKIYRRQIFKDSIIKQSTGDNKDPYRYFTNHELKELFQLESTTESVTQRQLEDLHQQQRCLDPILEEHLAYLHTLPIFGVSDHDLMFSQDPDDVDGDVMEEHGDVIRTKVAEAQNRVELEAQGFTGSEVPEQRWGDFHVETKPYEPKTKETEPHFEIEGLYDQLDSLKVEDDVVENIFNKSKISIPSDDESDIKPKIEDFKQIHILDSDEEGDQMNRAISEDEILAADSPMRVDKSNNQTGTLEQMNRAISEDEILAADSPMRVDKSNNQTGTLEIGESFLGESFLEESNLVMDEQDAIPETGKESNSSEKDNLELSFPSSVEESFTAPTKKNRARLISDSGESEPPEGETISSEDRSGDEDGFTDMDDFIDDEEEDNVRRQDSLASFVQEEVIDDFDSPWNSSKSRKAKLKRRSTALPQRNLIESDESVDESKEYRETVESPDEDDGENDKMSLALSFQSDDEL
ncbi:DNA excision repair protein ERCC-6-like isoform X2 [Styela clava]